jgi:Fe2+ transport system protein B
MILLPKRAIPAFAVAALAIFIGVGTGFVACVPIFHPKNFKPVHLLYIPAFSIALCYVRHLWRKGREADKSSFVMEMPPRDMATMLGICLVIGFVIGVLLAQPSVQNASL